MQWFWYILVGIVAIVAGVRLALLFWRIWNEWD